MSAPFDPADADALQHAWLLPFEFADLTPELPGVSPAVVCDDGAVFVPGHAAGMGEGELADRSHGGAAPRSGRFQYAVAARLPDREAVVATSPEAFSEGRAWMRKRQAAMSCWLLRIESVAGTPVTMPLRGPEPVLPRRAAEGPAAVLVDLGMVLTRFERARFAQNFHTVFGSPAPEAGLARAEELRLPLERGEILVDEFLDRVLDPLNLAPPDRGALSRVWGSILSVKRSTVALVRRAAALPHVAVVVVSNTDPMMLRYAREVLGLSDLLESVCASCQDGVNPKGDDASLWERGRETARILLGADPGVVIAVDDVRDYLGTALASGAATHAIHYRSMAQFKYELGAAGLYLQLAPGA